MPLLAYAFLLDESLQLARTRMFSTRDLEVCCTKQHGACIVVTLRCPYSTAMLCASILSMQVLNAMLLGCIESTSPMAAEFTKTLLSKGAAADTWAPGGLSALMLAASENKVDIMELLLNGQSSADGEGGSRPPTAPGTADVQLLDGQRRTALMLAASGDHLLAVELLIRHGSQVRTGRSAHMPA